MALPSQACGLQGQDNAYYLVLAGNDQGTAQGWQQNRENWTPNAVTGSRVRMSGEWISGD